MGDILFAYITCKDQNQAEEIGKLILNKRLCACINIFPKMTSIYFWPPKEGKLEKSQEAVLIAKTNKKKYSQLEKEVEKVHSYDTPCIIGIPTYKISRKYLEWLKKEME